MAKDKWVIFKIRDHTPKAIVQFLKVDDRYIDIFDTGVQRS